LNHNYISISEARFGLIKCTYKSQKSDFETFLRENELLVYT